MMVGEVGDHHRAIDLMGEYTTGRRLHQCYSFALLGHDFTPAHIRGTVEAFFAAAPEGWPMWAFSNHDVMRHVSRWAAAAASPEALAKLAAAILLSLPGSVCLYQGEELGQTDTALDFDELTDPQGIAFWPAPMGRDGCRTPMVWEAEAPHAGFSSGVRTWLPVKPPQAAVAVDRQAGVAGSVLEFYRHMIALRRTNGALRTGETRFLDLPDPLLGHVRGGAVLCLFNLGRDAVQVSMRGVGVTLLSEAVRVADGVVSLGPNGFLLAACGADAAPLPG
jgi:alpha-glucosidase